MAAPAGKNLSDKLTDHLAFGPATPSSAAPRWVSLKDVDSILIVVQGLNGTTVTGSAVALSQATAVAGTGAKALAFNRMYANTDPANTTLKTLTAVASNTFTTITNNNFSFTYEIPIDQSDLDVANGFDCVRVTLGNAANTSIVAHYVINPSYGGRAQAFTNNAVD